MSNARMAAQAGGTQARASLQRIRRGGIASGSAWTVSTSLTALSSHLIAGAMQPQPHQEFFLDVIWIIEFTVPTGMR